jgi:cold shock CspA family protein
MLMRVGEQRTCRECSVVFTLTAGEVDYFAMKGLACPKRCPECRRRRRRPGCDQPIRTGIVAAYVERGGFGFVEPDDGGPGVFLHIEVQPALPALVGRRVRFAAHNAERGPRATWCEPESPDGAGEPAPPTPTDRA